MIALKSQIPQGQKLALAGIFSMSLIITIFSIIRFTLNSSGHVASPIRLQVWSTIEQSVSVTVACLASFRVFVINQRRKSEQTPPRGGLKNKSSSSSRRVRLPSVKVGLADLRSQWGNPSIEPRRTESMELQLLDATSVPSPAQAAASLEHREIAKAF